MKDGDLKFRREETTCHSRARIYVPRIILDMMAATNKNSTSTYFGMGHMC